MSFFKTTHLVLAKETLYGIEKKYNVSDEALKKQIPS
jgi:LysM repeat protein